MTDLRVCTGQVINNASSALPSNPLSAFSATKHKPALGPTFTFLSDTTLWLARARDAVLKMDAGSSSSKCERDYGDLFLAEVYRSRSSVGVKFLRVFVGICLQSLLQHGLQASKVWWPFVIQDGVLREYLGELATESQTSISAEPATWAGDL